MSLRTIRPYLRAGLSVHCLDRARARSKGLPGSHKKLQRAPGSVEHSQRSHGVQGVHMVNPFHIDQPLQLEFFDHTDPARQRHWIARAFGEVTAMPNLFSAAPK